MKDLIVNTIRVAYSFYSHNGLLVFYGIGALIGLIKTFIKPSRFFLLIFVGFLVLMFSFEYDKHLIVQTRTHIVEQLIDPEIHGRQFKVATLFFIVGLPILLDILGWGLIFWALLTLRASKNE